MLFPKGHWIYNEPNEHLRKFSILLVHQSKIEEKIFFFFPLNQWNRRKWKVGINKLVTRCPMLGKIRDTIKPKRTYSWLKTLAKWDISLYFLGWYVCVFLKRIAWRIYIMMCRGYYYEHSECKTECVVLIY